MCTTGSAKHAFLITLSLMAGLFLFDSASPAATGAQNQPILEPVEWTYIRVNHADENDLPRVLFIGDSISKGYFNRVDKELDGKAYCAVFATSAFLSHEDFLQSLRVVLDRYTFAVIHANNGLHGWDYTEEQYRAGFPRFIRLLQEHGKGAKIIWALTTPLRDRENLEKLRPESIDRVRARNRIAREFIEKYGLGVSDLFSLSVDHPGHFGRDGTHFGAKGIAAQGKYIAGVVSKALEEIKGNSEKARGGTEAAEDPKAAAAIKIGVHFPENIDERLPRVLLVGDSICSGYHRQVRKLLEGKANVYAWISGINIRRSDIEKLQETALGAAKFDVVHFNIGLHGLGNRIPEEEYEPLLRKYVRNYKKYAGGARLIWASTTPIWDKKTGALLPDNDKIVRRNAVAARIMAEEGIPVTDLYSTVVDKRELGGGIHWSQEGYALMADAIVKNIEAALKARGGGASRAGRRETTVAARATAAVRVDTDLPATLRPVPREGKQWWFDRFRAMNERVKQGHVDLIFVGDSITQGWEGRGKKVWDKYYGRRRAVNLGISGDRTQHVLWRLRNGNLEGIAPKLAVVMIGTNNSGSDAPEDIARGVKAILDTIEEKCPETRILLLGVFPRGPNPADPWRRVNEKANETLSTFADDRLIFYMDIGGKFLEKDGTLSREIMPDLLHPNEKGYLIWAEAIEAKVKELMEEK